MRQFQIDLGFVSYPVFIGFDILEKLDLNLNTVRPEGNIVILIDDYIYKLKYNDIIKCTQNSRYFIYVIPARKNNKTFNAALKIFEYLDANNISRDSTILAIGGGVIGDIAGFIASCWYRGISLIHIPTTLLSAVDSCVGGKTAVNFRSTVNAVGTYHHPCAIFIDVELIKSLPRREISSGFGEIIKYSNIGGRDIRKLIENFDLEKMYQIELIIELSLKEKEKYVRNDIAENSKRLFLNFGHTIGHAIEFSTLYDGEETLRHGEGVALGMVAIFKICVILGYIPETYIDQLKNTLQKFSLPICIKSIEYGISRDALVNRIIELCFKDKKRILNKLRLILIDENYNPFTYQTNDRDLIKSGILEVVI